MQGLPEITAIILAGGQSKRMGRDKAFLTLGNKTFLRIIGEKLAGYCSQIIVSGNREKELYLSQLEDLNPEILFVKDLHPYAGPLNGIATCSQHVKHSYVFVATCDTPLLEEKLVPFFVKRLNGYEAIIPEVSEKLQFLNTLYTKEALKKSRKMYNNGIRSLRRWVEALNFLKLSENEIKAVDSGLYSYWSINTPEDYARLKALWGEKHG
ncbi:molybdenum cofactor guanylyltransferase [Persephonella sp.]